MPDPASSPPRPLDASSARLLVPQDGSAYDAPALQAALDLLGPRGELVLVTVIAPPEHIERDEVGRVLAYVDQQEEAEAVRARDALNAVAAELRTRATPIQVKVDVRVGDPASGIAMAAIDASADLIVMATHGRTGIRRALLGSVAGTVLRSSPTPVLLVHPHPTPAPAEPEAQSSSPPLMTF